MSRAFLILANDAIKLRALAWVKSAPTGTRVTFQAPRRTLDQNAKLWAMLTDVSRQIEWHGQKLTPDDWKLIFLDALKRELRVVPALDGRGFVNLGRSSSELSKAEMSDLIELIYAFGAERGVVWSEPVEREISCRMSR